MVIFPKFFNNSWWIHCWQIIASSCNKKGWNFFFFSLIQFSKLLNKQHYGPSISDNLDNLKSNWNLEALVKHRLYLIADNLYQKRNVCWKESQQIFFLVTTIKLLLKPHFKWFLLNFFLGKDYWIVVKISLQVDRNVCFSFIHAYNQT